MTIAPVDFDSIAADYDAARRLSADGLEVWRELLAPYFRALEPRPVLDLGTGTGQFAGHFANWFGVHVIAIDPSLGMLRAGGSAGADQRIARLAGLGEAIPLAAESCGLAWMSNVIHHMRDLAWCARELARVLAPQSQVIVRSAFPGRLERIGLFDYFPEAKAVCEQFPTVEWTAERFGEAGFVVSRFEAVPQRTADGLRHFYERARRRADTTLVNISDDEFAAGLERLRRAAERATSEAPMVDYLDMLVLTRGAAKIWP